MIDREVQRKQLQDYLDAQKTQKERNVLGQFSTPYPLAVDLMQYVYRLIGKDDVSFLEPAIGTGVFYSAFVDVFKGKTMRALGFEIDQHYFTPAKELWKDYPLEIRCNNFLTQHPGEKFDLLLTNPPYIRHHHIENNFKNMLQNKVIRQIGIKISALAGMYCYFMILSTSWLKNDGIACWLVPSEFMDVNYGKALKAYLLQQVELLHIHRFNEADLQFDDALVSSCIVVFRNRKPKISHKIVFSSRGTINNPEMSKQVDSLQLKTDAKWTMLFKQEIRNEETKAMIGDFFNVKRGIATGDNDFFILDEKTISQYEIPSVFLRPLLPSPRYIKGDRVNSENGLPILSRRQFLFSCNLPEYLLKEKYPTVWRYILSGMERGVQNGYICRHRTPWYSCEDRDPASIIVPYMGRSETGNRLFRFILNMSKAITTNVYLMLYPKPPYIECLKDEQMLTEIWRMLNAIPTDTLSSNGRCYGGGLRKLEPRELMHTPANDMASLMARWTGNRQLVLF